MIEYTKAAIEKTVNDFRTIWRTLTVGSQVLYIIYLIYAIAVPTGILWANIALCVASVAYLIFYLWAEKKKNKQTKSIKNTTRRVVSFFKIGVKGLTIVFILYSLYIATMEDVTAVTVIFTTITIICWILQLIFELGYYFVESHAKLILEAVKADAEHLVQPVKKVGDFIKKAIGREPEPEKKPSKTRKFLDKLVSKRKEAKERDKEIHTEADTEDEAAESEYETSDN